MRFGFQKEVLALACLTQRIEDRTASGPEVFQTAIRQAVDSQYPECAFVAVFPKPIIGAGRTPYDGFTGR